MAGAGDMMAFTGPNTFAFRSPFLHKKKKVKNHVLWLCWYKDKYNPDWIYFYTFVILTVILGILFLREIEIKTFLWPLKSSLGSMYCVHSA